LIAQIVLMHLQSLSPELSTLILLRYLVLGASAPIFPLASNDWYGLCFSSDSQILKQFSDNNALDKELYWLPVAYLYSKKPTPSISSLPPLPLSPPSPSDAGWQANGSSRFHKL